MVIRVSTVLLLIGLGLALRADAPTTGPNLQTAGLVLMLAGVTALALTFAVRDHPG